MAKPKVVVKIFAYVIRFDGAAAQGEPRLLVMESDAVPGRFEVVRGKAEKSDPSIVFTGLREVYEEAGLDSDALAFESEIGQNLWQPPHRLNRIEEQHALVFRAPDGLPERFDHVVVSDAGDNGLLFRYHWKPITPALTHELAEGADTFVPHLLKWVQEFRTV
ncbi:MAG: hypothetical protein U0670_16310 [Anaerolineae bacterium]